MGLSGKKGIAVQPQQGYTKTNKRSEVNNMEAAREYIRPIHTTEIDNDIELLINFLHLHRNNSQLLAAFRDAVLAEIHIARQESGFLPQEKS